MLLIILHVSHTLGGGNSLINPPTELQYSSFKTNLRSFRQNT